MAQDAQAPTATAAATDGLLRWLSKGPIHTEIEGGLNAIANGLLYAGLAWPAWRWMKK